MTEEEESIPPRVSTTGRRGSETVPALRRAGLTEPARLRVKGSTMTGMLILGCSVLGSGLAWALGRLFGTAAGLILSMIGGALGAYYGRRISRNLL